MTVQVRAPIRVAWENRDGRHTSEAQPVWQQDGLAVTPTLDCAKGYFSITHVASGWALMCEIRGQRKAIRAAKRFLPLYDWTRSRTAIQKNRQLMARCVAERAELRKEGILE